MIDEARSWALRAIELAEQFGATEALSSALNTLGTSQLPAGSEEGSGNLARSLAVAEASGNDNDVARWSTSPGWRSSFGYTRAPTGSSSGDAGHG